jgi:hypothetical protein
MDKKLLKLIIIGAALLIGCIVLMVLYNKVTGGVKYTYNDVVKQSITATKSYLNANPSRYPNNSTPFTTIAFATLVDEKYIKSASELFKDDSAVCY